MSRKRERKGENTFVLINSFEHPDMGFEDFDDDDEIKNDVETDT